MIQNHFSDDAILKGNILNLFVHFIFQIAIQMFLFHSAFKSIVRSENRSNRKTTTTKTLPLNLWYISLAHLYWYHSINEKHANSFQKCASLEYWEATREYRSSFISLLRQASRIHRINHQTHTTPPFLHVIKRPQHAFLMLWNIIFFYAK